MVVSNNDTNLLNAGGRQQFQSYLIDYDGNIDFPVLGKLKVAGLNRTELTAMLVKKISEYANNPIVNVRLSNFTITILGEVRNPGTFTIQDERITVLEALGLVQLLKKNQLEEMPFSVRKRAVDSVERNQEDSE